MIAIINVAVKGGYTNSANNDLVGWGGDLAQLALELKGLNLTGTDLQNKAYQLFNSQESTFSSQDLLADLDAINLSYIYENLTQENQSLSFLIKHYYNVLNTKSRKQNFLTAGYPNFINFENGELTKTQEQMAEQIIERLSGNFLLNIWCDQNGVSFNDDAEEFMASAMAFAKYFID